ncbi:MAG: hypothetical protein WDW38_005259 [Sanguina aurantia]
MLQFPCFHIDETGNAQFAVTTDTDLSSNSILDNTFAPPSLASPPYEEYSEPPPPLPLSSLSAAETAQELVAAVAKPFFAWPSPPKWPSQPMWAIPGAPIIAPETISEMAATESYPVAEPAPTSLPIAEPEPAYVPEPAYIPEPVPVFAASTPSSSSSSSGTTTVKGKLTAAGTPYSNPGGKWSQFKSYSTFQRSIQIWGFAIQFAWKYALLSKKFTYGKMGMLPELVSARKRELAVWLREGLVKLGPTFIKIGQQFSTRVDVLSPEFVKELEVLQDNVPPFDSETAREIITQSLGRPVEEVFQDFGADPIAAASLGQVHRATLNGERVVIKVQRPGLKALFDIDLKNVRALAVWLQKLDPKTDGAARDWVAIYDECSRILYQEIDYRLEGKNADMFRENFKGVEWVKVPRVYWEYSGAEVLVLEYAPGVKINDGEGIDRLGLDRKKLARLSVESYLQQILKHGLFHADPHPGNVAVDAVNGGRLIYYDFGMMGTIAPTVKGGLLDLFYGVYNKDPEKCLEALTTMGVYIPSGDKTAVRRTAEFFLAAFQDRLVQQRAERDAMAGTEYGATYKPQRSKDESKTRRKQIQTTIGEDLLLAANDQPFRFPATFTFVVRSFTVLDGIGKSLDPRFDISEIAAPYARELLLEGSPQFVKLGQNLFKGLTNQNKAVANLFRNPNRVEDVAGTLLRLERGDLKLRVRALEAERALSRVEPWQRVVSGTFDPETDAFPSHAANTTAAAHSSPRLPCLTHLGLSQIGLRASWQRVVSCALVASSLVNVGTVLSVSLYTTGATAAFVGATFFAFLMMKSYFAVVKSEKKELQLAGAA